jgi:hypothetical protein
VQYIQYQKINFNFFKLKASSTLTSTTTSSTTPTTVTQCQSLNCAYGQTFDPNICKCNCLPGFSGTLCDKPDCNVLVDATECSDGIFTCASPEEIGQCPNMCGYCY